MDDANLESLGADESTDNVSNEQSQETETQNETEDNSSLDGLLKDYQTEETNSIDLLQKVNEMGILRNGLPVEFDDVAKIKEYISKGFDYTQKTQEVAETRRQFETEFQQQREAFETEKKEFEQKNQEVLQNYSVLSQVLTRLQQNDPDLFNELDQMYREIEMQTGHFNHPQFGEFKKEIGEIKEMLGRQKEETVTKQLEDVRNGWENELKETQTKFGAKLRSLGVKPNWKKVQDIWSADTTNSMSVEKALHAVHGEDIIKALEAKTKLAQTKKMSAQRTNVNTEDIEQNITPKTTHGSGTYMNYIEDLYKKHVS